LRSHADRLSVAGCIPHRIHRMFTLSINGEARPLPRPLTVAELVSQLGHDRRRVAVEVNEVVVPLVRQTEHVLADGDRVEIVTLVGGGAADVPAGQPRTVGEFSFRSAPTTG